MDAVHQVAALVRCPVLCTQTGQASSCKGRLGRQPKYESPTPRQQGALRQWRGRRLPFTCQ